LKINSGRAGARKKVGDVCKKGPVPIMHPSRRRCRPTQKEKLHLEGEKFLNGVNGC